MQINEYVRMVCDEIVTSFSPLKIILFNFKRSISGEPRSFKLCVILKTNDKWSAEKKIYLDVDSEIPFDVIVYTPEEWQELLQQKNSFANRIKNEGTFIYEAGESTQRTE